MNVDKILWLTIITFLVNIFKTLCLSKNKYLFKYLIVDRKKLDPSYTYKYDNIQWNHKIIAIGDIHGDVESLKLILRHSNLIDENDEWIAEDVMLVQVGDILDRGVFGTYIYDYLLKLQKDAIKKNSKVILIMGNHEQLNLCGAFHYVNESEVMLFFQNNRNNRLFSFTNKNGYYFKKLIRLPVIVKINNIIFTHGGISKHMSEYDINTINLKTRLQIENKCKMFQFEKYNYLSKEGVLWNNEISHQVKLQPKKTCKHLRNILKKYNAKGLVVGHTRQKSHEIQTYCNNSFFLIDTGMSLFMNNGQPYPNYLQIEKGKFKTVHLIVQEYNRKKMCQGKQIQLSKPYKKMICLSHKIKDL